VESEAERVAQYAHIVPDFCDYRVSASIPGNPNIRSYGICKKKSIYDI